jgi:hypothetical protein
VRFARDEVTFGIERKEGNDAVCLHVCARARARRVEEKRRRRRRRKEIDGTSLERVHLRERLETVEVCVASYSDASAPSDTDCTTRSAKIGYFCRAELAQLTAPDRTMRHAAVRSPRER